MFEVSKKFIQLFGLVLCLALITKAQSNSQMADALLAKLECPDRVKAVAFSPDGKLLAAGYGWGQGGARIWSVADRKTVATLVVGKEDANVACVAFSPDGKLFAAANWDGDVVLWTVGSWGSHKTVLSNRGSPETLAFSPTGMKLAFLSENIAVLYDLHSGKETTLSVGKHPEDSLISVSFSPDGRTATVFRDSAVEVRDADSGKLIRSWKPSGSGFFGSVSPDGRYAIAGGGAIYGKKTVEIWGTKDGRKVGEISEFRSGLFALAISNSGKVFALAGGNYGGGGELSLWNLEEAREVGFVSFGHYPIHGLAFNSDDSILAAASDDGFVLLYAVDRIRGPQVKKQDSTLCGEIMAEGNRAFIVPISKVPNPMRSAFEFPWRLEIANAGSVAAAAGTPVVLEDWAIESNSARDYARVNKFRPLLSQGPSLSGNSDHIIFGEVRNPGWDEGFVAKIYGDGSFVATNNSGKCLSSGNLGQLNTDFESVKKRLTNEGLIAIPREPLTLGASHYRTSFIELALNGISELRSDADSIEVLLKGGPAKKREAFSRIFKQEEPFINSLLRAGMKSAPN